MSLKKILGLAAIGGALFLAAPSEQAKALSLINPGAAVAVQSDAHAANTTEVRWWRHRGGRHWGWRRHWRRW